MAAIVIDELITILGTRLDTRGVDRWVARIEAARRRVDTAASAVSRVGAVGAAAVGLLSRAVYQFDKEFGQVRGTMEAAGSATQAQLKDLEGFIKNLAKTSQFSASQVAAAAATFARAGFGIEDIFEGLPMTLNLAAAGAVNVTEATTIAARQLKAYGREIGDLSQVTDYLAYASANANTTLQSLAYQTQIPAPSITQMGGRMSDAYATTAILQDIGMVETAGTGLRSVLTMLLRLAGKQEKEEGDNEKLNVFRGMGISQQMILEHLNRGDFLGIFRMMASSGAVDITTSAKVFEQRQVSVVNALLNPETMARVLAMAEGLRERSAGTADVMARGQLSGFYGFVTFFFSKLDTFFIKLGEAGITDNVERLGNAISALVDAFDALDPRHQRMIANLISLGGALLIVGGMLTAAAWALGGLAFLVTAATWIWKAGVAFTVLAGAVWKFIAGVWAMGKVVGIAGALSIAFPKIAAGIAIVWGVIKTIAIGIAAVSAPLWGTAALVVAAIALLGAAIWFFWDEIKSVPDKIRHWIAQLKSWLESWLDWVPEWWDRDPEGNPVNPLTFNSSPTALAPGAHGRQFGGSTRNVTINHNERVEVHSNASDPEAVAREVVRQLGDQSRTIVEDADDGIDR